MRSLSIFGLLLTGCHPLANGDFSPSSLDATKPPPAGPDLYLGWFSPGAVTGVTITGVAEGDEVHLSRAAAIGSGPCPLVLDGMCLDLVAPLRRFPATIAEAGGWAYVSVRVPSSVDVGRRFSLQAAILTDEGAALTPAYATSIEDGGVCFGLYEPVCGLDSTTYSNTCMAEMAGMVIDYDGPC
jgi:hypothetical protein